MALPEATTEALSEIVSKAVEAFTEGEAALPTERKRVVDCAVLSLFAMLDEYVGGKTKLSAELDALAEALFNQEDEVVLALDAGNRQMMWMVVNLLRQRRRLNHGRQSKEGGSAGGSGRSGGESSGQPA